MTKKEIRTALAPMSRALLNGAPTQRMESMGLKIKCSRLYGAPGQIGPAWNPDFTVINPAINKIVHGGRLVDVVDQLYRRSQGPRGPTEIRMLAEAAA